MILPPLALNDSVTRRLSASLTFDFNRVVAPRVPRSRAYSSPPARIAVRLHQLDDRCGNEAPIDLFDGQAAADGPADRRQRLGKAREPARLERLADLGPFGVIAVLQPAGGILADGLQMGGRVGCRSGRWRRPAARPGPSGGGFLRASRTKAPEGVTKAKPLPQRWRRSVSASGPTITRPFSSASRATIERCDISGKTPARGGRSATSRARFISPATWKRSRR